MKRAAFIPAAMAAFLLDVSIGPASAHHSFAQFDMSKTVTLHGTVRTLEWTNPHLWLWLDVPDSNGGNKVWGLEGAAVGEMSRRGWSRQIVKAGDKITVEIHPLRDGRAGGSLGKVTLADGSVLAGGQAPGAPTGSDTSSSAK
jgi:hypothetical protein